MESSQAPNDATVLSELKEDILRTFELEWMDPDWNPTAELQKIFDEFDLGNDTK
jgi:hypothetical protein